ncbi:DJ-1/PfpI family protein [Desulfobulbus sp. AH-315-M07]|nr:DJ-1/PfpI family protein [Desulfobulbus sp. AH-315-M07]
MSPMHIAFFLFEGLTALDLVGPLEVLARLPAAEVSLVAKRRGVLHCGATSGGLGLEATAELRDIDACDVLVIPGGRAARDLVDDKRVIDWITKLHPNTRYTTSVCTGSLLLGAAGVLRGLRATTHRSEREFLASFGATVVSDRVVTEGKVITAAGVSSGIDMALTLAAKLSDDDTARAIQVQIEYDPQPPFDIERLLREKN